MGVFSSVVVSAGGGTTRFFAAEWGQRVWRSTNGIQWTEAGTGFPSTDVGRIAMGVQPDNPNLVYALVAKSDGKMLGVWRLDGVTAPWKRVANQPDILPSPQGDYDLAIAVDPSDADLIYLGGSYYHDNQYWPASVWRCQVQPSGSAYAGTTRGEVFRLNRSGNTWQVTRLDNAAGGALPLQGLVADIAVDWSDANLESIYIAFGGTGDYRHVWFFDGTRWQARSGPAGDANNLLDVEHNAIVVDRAAPQNVYVGADIGVWHSPDRGQNCQPLPNGLPDAPVFDLQFHPTRRLLRASTHGRGLFELEIV
jgi:hypothetical protein